MTLRIVVADDHAPFRSCLKALLERQPGVAEITEIDGGRQAVDHMARPGADGLPDVLILDLEMSDLGGLASARQILSCQPQARILILSWHDDLPLVDAAIDAGVRGYMLKDDPLPELLQAIGDIAAGRTYLSRALRAQLSGRPMSAFC